MTFHFRDKNRPNGAFGSIKYLRQVTEEVDSILRREIAFMFGRQIASSGDCIQLSEEIFRVTKVRLNSNTLRRFFGLVKTSYSPSASTLQILCNYCGFSSLDEVRNYKRSMPPGASPAVEQQPLLSFLINIFRDTPVAPGRNKTFGSIVKQTIIFLNQNLELVERFQSAIAKTENGQAYYFGTYVQIDRLNSCFGNGLRYFLAEKQDSESQIFGHSLLLFRDWLIENQQGMDRHYQEITASKYQSSFSPHASGRYFASLLYHAEAKELSFEQIMESVHAYNKSLESGETEAQVEFALIIAEALILTRKADEGFCYAELALKKHLGEEAPEESVTQNLYLLQALALFQKGEVINAEAVYLKIRPTSFSFLNKKLQTILYAELTSKFAKVAEGVDNQQAILIKETGFLRLQKLATGLELLTEQEEAVNRMVR